MSSQNDSTIEAYDLKGDSYIERDKNRPRDGFYNQWLDSSFRSLPAGARVLEIGSARGVDAPYLTQKDLAVQTSDVSRIFINHLNEMGLRPLNLNIIDEVPPHEYDAVLASAVFVHFTTEDLQESLGNIRKGLKPNGILVFSVIEGDSRSTMRFNLGSPRYFRYWQFDELKKMLNENNFTVHDIRRNKYVDADWLYIVAKKIDKSSEVLYSGEV